MIIIKKEFICLNVIDCYDFNTCATYSYILAYVINCFI